MTVRCLAVLVFLMASFLVGCDSSADKDKNKDNDMPKPAKAT